jgi:hypothetical protein
MHLSDRQSPTATALEMASQQREISVPEFFLKNRHSPLPAACFGASTIAGFGTRRVASSSSWVGSRLALHAASFSKQHLPVYCLVDCDPLASPAFTAHRKWSPATRLTSRASCVYRRHVSSVLRCRTSLILAWRMRMGVRAEQQALAKWGLNYVIEESCQRSSPTLMASCLRKRHARQCPPSRRHRHHPQSQRPRRSPINTALPKLDLGSAKPYVSSMNLRTCRAARIKLRYREREQE